ncbi:hypothetical protein NBJODN_NBJODN_06550, partial [Dysosmobacter welbionis]
GLWCAGRCSDSGGAPPQAPDLCLAVFGGHGADLRPDAGGLRQNRGAVSGVPPGERPRRLFAGGGAVRLLRRPVAEPGPLAHGGDRLQGVLLHLLDAPVLPGLPGGQGPLRRDAAARLGRAGAGGRGLRGRLSGVAGPPAGAGGENLSDLRRKLCCMPFAP